ncbi:hypothetical protein [Algoriphagus litoralis]|uniref:hypothetical protein n=1 Tax=Algoriphagus litoralis TaxID=2202829 RepID=UPI000DBA0D6C|nr:hypothetical protein [Algoriphagus litoralis]
MFQKWFFSQEQSKILQECRIENKEDNFQWFTKNVIMPLVIVFFPALIYFIFSTDVKDVNTIIFNGSISLIGINVLFGMSTYLIKVQRNRKENIDESSRNKEVEDKLNQEVINLRGRLDDYKNILVFLGAGIYCFQALIFDYNSPLLFYFFLLLTLIVFLLSIYVGRNMFIIKDDFFERTYYKEVNSPVIETRKRWESKYQ